MDHVVVEFVLAEAIAVQQAKHDLANDESITQKYFERFLRADLDDPEVRESLITHFIDKIEYEPGKLVVYGDYYDRPEDSLFNPMTVEVPEDGGSPDFPKTNRDLAGFVTFAVDPTREKPAITTKSSGGLSFILTVFTRYCSQSLFSLREEHSTFINCCIVGCAKMRSVLLAPRPKLLPPSATCTFEEGKVLATSSRNQ